MPQCDQKEGPVTKVNVGRLTNSIFVFTLLLLFKNIQTPAFGDLLDKMSPHDYGLMQLPDIMSFLIAFVIIAMIWILTFHIFHMVARVDRAYLYLHLAMLMTIIMIPVASHYTVIFPNKSVFPVLFHCVMLAIGILLLLEWVHIYRKPSVFRDGIALWQKRCITLKMLFLPGTACAGILLATFDLPSTQYIYLFTMLAFLLMSAYSWKNLKRGMMGGGCP